MVVQCPHCLAKFRFNEEKITQRSVKVRCTKCKQVFSVYKSKTAEFKKAEEAEITPTEPRASHTPTGEFYQATPSTPPAQKAPPTRRALANEQANNGLATPHFVPLTEDTSSEEAKIVTAEEEADRIIRAHWQSQEHRHSIHLSDAPEAQEENVKTGRAILNNQQLRQVSKVIDFDPDDSSIIETSEINERLNINQELYENIDETPLMEVRPKIQKLTVIDFDRQNGVETLAVDDQRQFAYGSEGQPHYRASSPQLPVRTLTGLRIPNPPAKARFPKIVAWFARAVFMLIILISLTIGGAMLIQKDRFNLYRFGFVDTISTLFSDAPRPDRPAR